MLSVFYVGSDLMLIIWNTLLLPEYQRELVYVDTRVQYWPACYMKECGYNVAIPIEWWISFSRVSFGIVWCIKHPEHSKIVYSK